MKTEVLNHPAINSEITNQPAIYCGTYKKYNEGSIFGKWIDLTLCDNYEDFISICKEIHSDEQDPEFMFQDFQSIPESFISESYIDPSFFELLEIVPEEQRDLFIKYCEYVGADTKNPAATFSDFEDAYCGEYDSDLDFGTDFFEQCGYEIPEYLVNYIDYEAFTRDLMYDYFSIDGHYFRNI